MSKYPHNNATGWSDTYLRHLDHRIRFLEICKILAMEVGLCIHATDPGTSGGSENKPSSLRK